jgi:tol-pal system protein YbgF
MKRAAAALLTLVVCACASSKQDRIEAQNLAEINAHNPPAPASAEATDARIAELQTSMTELLERIDVLNDRIAKLEAGAAPPQPATRTPQPATPATRVPQPATQSKPLAAASIAENYRSAIMLFGKNRLADARTVFQQVFDADPSGDLADNALFWIGETYYVSGDYKTAMRYYTRVVKEYPEQNKAPDAMYKLALAYEKTGDVGMARTTLEEVVRKYPYSTSAASAKVELKRTKY